jgi:hypothetical protein
MLEWDENGPPESVDAAAVNKWLFNIDTVDKVLAHVMTHGLKVEGGDRLGKTIIFAKNQAHAEFIEERFNANYPKLAGHFARMVTYKTEYAQSIIDDFSNKEKMPHIAVSVDMLDTGIDVPEVGNLVLFKLIRSKTKFWQILGRGTRLCEDLFGPGKDKECFYVFDYCQNLEFFGQNPAVKDAAAGKGLSERLFEARLDHNPPRAARAYALMNVALSDVFTACWEAKFTYWAIRPMQLDPTVTTVFTTPNHPSYPAAHASVGGAMETVLGALFPRAADDFAKLADEESWSRLWAGIHFRSDIEAGRQLGRNVGHRVVAHARQDGAD